jgi:Flp pilus assembly pilin Flp
VSGKSHALEYGLVVLVVVVTLIAGGAWLVGALHDAQGRVLGEVTGGAEAAEQEQK